MITRKKSQSSCFGIFSHLTQLQYIFFNQPFHSSFGFASLQVRYPGSEFIVCHYVCEYIYLKQIEAQSASVEPANKRDVCLCIDTCVTESAKNGGYIIICYLGAPFEDVLLVLMYCWWSLWRLACIYSHARWITMGNSGLCLCCCDPCWAFLSFANNSLYVLIFPEHVLNFV